MLQQSSGGAHTDIPQILSCRSRNRVNACLKTLLLSPSCPFPSLPPRFFEVEMSPQLVPRSQSRTIDIAWNEAVALNKYGQIEIAIATEVMCENLGNCSSSPIRSGFFSDYFPLFIFFLKCFHSWGCAHREVLWEHPIRLQQCATSDQVQATFVDHCIGKRYPAGSKEDLNEVNWKRIDSGRVASCM